MSELWTIEQLPDRVAELLADNDYDGQSNGRVQELPSGRTIRWYTTIGLVDRPAAMRGRTVLYGYRHLLQLVAVKKLQSSGHSLAKIQELLVGATDKQLADLAGLARLDIVRPEIQVSAPTSFWKGSEQRRPIADTATDDTVTNGVARPVHGVRLGDSVTVVLEAADRAPNADELAAIQAAAAPLLDLLGRIGLAPITVPNTGGERS